MVHLATARLAALGLRPEAAVTVVFAGALGSGVYLLGRMHDVGMGLRDEATLRVLAEDVLKTSEIEGEKLPKLVRSSIARHLGLDIGDLVSADRHVDGVVDMVMDATQRHARSLTDPRPAAAARATN